MVGDPGMPPWKYRRILIYGSCILAAGMIVFAALTYRSDTQVGTQLIVGGVALLSIVVTAYTGFATYEDAKLWKMTQQVQEEIYPEGGSDE
jgi:hypothetical protein